MITEIITVVCTLIATLGGWEAIKWLINRKSNKRINNAIAAQEESKALNSQFEILSKTTIFLQAQLEEAHKRNASKEDMFSAQTQRLREVQDKLDNLRDDIASKREELASLKAERALKLCERRGCKERQPQSGY